MDYSLKSENRKFIRVVTELSADYKFLGDESSFPDLGKMFKGTIRSIGAGGLMLCGPLADRSWIPRFIWQKIVIGVKFHPPNDERQIAALCRVAWIEDDEKGDSNDVKFGLIFREISNRDQDRVIDFVIHSYME